MSVFGLIPDFHVGHTPQQVAGPIRDARIAGMLTSTAVRAAAAGHHVLASQAFPRLHRVEELNTVQTTLEINEWASRMDPLRQPWPFSFREGFQPNAITLPGRQVGGPARSR